jgi:hypothetical protein
MAPLIDTKMNRPGIPGARSKSVSNLYYTFIFVGYFDSSLCGSRESKPRVRRARISPVPQRCPLGEFCRGHAPS